MTAAKNVYALMLALVIVLSGCFGNTADDTDAQEPDDTTTTIVNNTTTIVNNFYNTTTIQTGEEWFTQGGVVDTQWLSEPSTRQVNPPANESNVTECEDIGGTVDYPWGMSNGPYCDIYVSSISTPSGVMLVVHESYGVSTNTTCEGFTVEGLSHYTGSDERRAYGSSMNCTHDIFIDNVQPVDTDQSLDRMWSITYSLRNVTVV